MVVAARDFKPEMGCPKIRHTREAIDPEPQVRASRATGVADVGGRNTRRSLLPPYRRWSRARPAFWVPPRGHPAHPGHPSWLEPTRARAHSIVLQAKGAGPQTPGAHREAWHPSRPDCRSIVVPSLQGHATTRRRLGACLSSDTPNGEVL